MSILIKDLKMPDNCDKCQLCYDYLECMAASHHIRLNFETRPKDCPLVEVPAPHGRLIDARELKQDIHTHQYILTDVWHSTDNGMFTNGIDYAISVAHTIIEEEDK